MAIVMVITGMWPGLLDSSQRIRRLMEGPRQLSPLGLAGHQRHGGSLCNADLEVSGQSPFSYPLPQATAPD